ncbi:MAG: peroxiredoxin [Planctomycetes bacterium]|nr:peroxiredoxin [Planctomycetota bacterium]
MNEMSSEPSQLLRVGDEAPDFSLEDHNGNPVTLSEFSGKKNVVLVFYPRDNTPGCTKQLCAVRDQFDLFADRETVVLGINPQDSRSHRKFFEKHSFPFPLLVDHEKKVLSVYGCRGTLMTKRTVYGIDKEGAIVFARRGTPSNEEVLGAFKER